LDPPPAFQLPKSKLIHQNNVRRRDVLLAEMQGASKGTVAKDLETENDAPVWYMGNQRDKFVYYIVQKYLENLCGWFE
jgi:hypothetical protein